MLFNFFLLTVWIIVAIASANPVAMPSQSPSDIIDYSTDLVIQENPFPLLVQSIGALTGFQKTAISNAVDIISWLLSNISYIITAAVVSFCRLSNLCMDLEQYLPITRITSMMTTEHLETAERVLIRVMENYFEGRK